MSRLHVAALAGALAAVGALAVASGGASQGASPAFKITRIVAPTIVQVDKRYPSPRTYWEGTPTLPITLRGRTLCPDNVACAGQPTGNGGWSSTSSQQVQGRQNPIVLPPARTTYCTGGITGYVVGYEQWLTDARGRSTPKYRSFFYCSQ
jgi:hypothetical protein